MSKRAVSESGTGWPHRGRVWGAPRQLPQAFLSEGLCIQPPSPIESSKQRMNTTVGLPTHPPRGGAKKEGCGLSQVPPTSGQVPDRVAEGVRHRAQPRQLTQEPAEQATGMPGQATQRLTVPGSSEPEKKRMSR